MTAPIVSVRGESTVEADPEQAVVNLGAVAREPTQAETASVLGERRAALAAVIAQYAEAIESYDGGSMQIYPEFDRKTGNRVVRYVGQASYRVTVHDFTVLSDLLLAASAVPLSEVNGPHWQLRRDSETYRQARIQAVSDAVRRAHEYANAFGATVTSLLEVSDLGMSTSFAEGKMSFVSRTSGMAHDGGAPVEPVFDLEPVRQHVTGMVEARFTMSEADLARPTRPARRPDP